MNNGYVTGEKGRALIKEIEGFSPKVYTCPAGHPTIGYGHKLRSSEVYNGTITKEFAEKLLQMDLREAEVAVKRLVTRPLSQNQFDALVSFVYNFGMSKFARSTLLKKVNKSEDMGVPAQFLMWIHSDGKPLPGLLRRRCMEAALYMTP